MANNESSWITVYDGAGTIHIYPLGDSREHEEEPDCWCIPTLNSELNPTYPSYIHNSADKREIQ